MRRPRRHALAARALLVGLAIIPACLILLLILRYGVDMPVWDQWEYVPFFEKFSQGTLTLGDLFAQQNEYRQFFPNLIFVGLGWLTRWNLRYEMMASFALACLVSFNVYRLGRLTLGGGNPARGLAIYVLANLLIFSPIQYDNWLQGMQLIYFMPVACISTCLVVAYSKLSARTKFAACMCLSVVSTFSSANGILCWLVVLPVLAWSGSREEWRAKRWLVSAWMAGLLLSAAVYFYDYQKPVHHPGLSELAVHPLKAAAYLMVLLGNALDVGGVLFLKNPWGTSHKIVAAATGLTLAALFVWSLLQILRDTRPLAYRAAGWLMLGAYSLASAVLVTFGRAGYGIEQAFAPRYTTLTVYLPVALVYLLPLILEARTTGEKGRRVVKKGMLLPTLLVLFLCTQLLAYASGIRQMSALGAKLRQGKACLLFINLVREDCLTQTVYPDVEKLRRAANSLDALGFLRPALMKSARVEDIAADGAQHPGHGGSLVAVTQTGEHVYTASGWAVLPGRGEPADAVLLTYDRAGSDSIVFALADTGEERSVVARTLGRASAPDYARWQKSFSVQNLPANPVIINAWAFDARTGQAFKLDGTHVVQNPNAPVSRK